MGRVAGISLAAASASAPTMALISGGAERDDEVWRSFDNSVNAVSFGFVATAILISMFLVMAVFERFLRPRSTDAPAGGGGRGRTPDGDDEATMRKPEFPSPKMTVYPKGVSVLMPGESIPTFLAHPAPPPCPPECVVRPVLQ